MMFVVWPKPVGWRQAAGAINTTVAGEFSSNATLDFHIPKVPPAPVHHVFQAALMHCWIFGQLSFSNAKGLLRGLTSGLADRILL